MSRILKVWFLGNQAGRFFQDDSGRLSFAYADTYLTGNSPWPVTSRRNGATDFRRNGAT